MARIIENVDIVSSTIEGFLQQNLADYSNTLNNSPIFLKYYSKNHYESRADINLGAVAEVVGKDSPVKFDLIDNIPIYNLSGVSLSSTNDGFGLEANLQATGVIIPDTIIPHVDDFFSTKYQGDTVLYRISKVTPSIMQGKRYYSVEFYLSAETLLAITGQVSSNYQLIGDDTSVTNTNIVLQSDALLIQDLTSIRAAVQDKFLYRYFDSRLNELGMLLSTGGSFISDSVLTSFILKEALLKRRKAFKNEFTPDTHNYIKIHKSSVYELLYSGDVSKFTDVSVVLTALATVDRARPISHYWYDVLSGTYLPTLRNATILEIPLYDGLAQYLTDTTGTVLAVSKYHPAIKDFLGKDSINFISNIRKVEDDPQPNVWDYYYFPLVIFMCKTLIQQLIKKQ